MTLAMPDPSNVWNRTLPHPNTILQNIPAGTFAKRSSSLLQHHLVSRNLSQEVFSSDVGRRSTVPCISYHERRSSGLDGGQTFMVDSSSQKSALLPSAPLDTLTRKKDASHMAKESVSRPESPSNVIAGEGAKEFCLCQPDPKIPRPRNGKRLCASPLKCCVSFLSLVVHLAHLCQSWLIIVCICSFYIVPATSTSCGRCTTPRFTESGDIKDNR